MNFILLSCCFNFFINNCFALTDGNRTYNPNLSSVVYIRYNIEDHVTECTGIVISSTYVLTSSVCLEPYIRKNAKHESNYVIAYAREINFKTLFYVFVNIQTIPLKSTDARLDAKHQLSINGFKFVAAQFKGSYQNLYDSLYGNETQPHTKVSLIIISPAINMTQMNITQIKNRTSNEYPKTIIIVGYDDDGYLSWAKVPTIPCPMENEEAFNKSVCVDGQNNSTAFLNFRDFGGPAFNEKYEFVGVYCGYFAGVNYYSVHRDFEIKEKRKKGIFVKAKNFFLKKKNIRKS